MDVKAFLRHAHERAAEFKELRVKADGAKSAMPFIVVANRGSEHVATFFPTNRDPMLWVMRLAVGAFGCDLVAGTVDAYQVVAGEPGNKVHINPDTKQPWEPGGMGRAFELHRPWVTECLMTNAIDKVEQKIHSLTQSYKAKHYKIKFHEAVDLSGNDQLTGLVPDALRSALATPDVIAMMHRLVGKGAFDMSPLEQRAHADVVAMRLCLAQQIPILYNVSDPDVRGIVELSLGDEERNAAMGAPGIKLIPMIPGL